MVAPWPAEPEPDWTRPLDDGERELLQHYRGFSQDGAHYAFAEPPPQGGPASLFVQRTDTPPGQPQTERHIALDSAQGLARAVSKLADGGYPRPGAAPPVPSAIAVLISGSDARLTVGGVPRVRWRPFADVPDSVVLRAEPTTFWSGGRRVAVRATGRTADGRALPVRHATLVVSEAPGTAPPAG